MNSKPLDQKVAIVTGGGSGIGVFISKTLAESGATVVLVGRREANLKEVADQISQAGGKAVPMPTDISDPDQCVALVKNTVDQLGRLDILVNNATATHMRGYKGGGSSLAVAKAVETEETTHLQDVTLDDWRQSIAVNVMAPFILTREAIPHLAKQERAFVVNTGAIGTRFMYPGGGYGVYVATKNAARSMMVVFSKELRKYTNIRVHIVNPGMVATPRLTQAIAGGSSSELKDVKLVNPQDIADAMLFLVTRETNGMIDEISVRREDANYYCYP